MINEKIATPNSRIKAQNSRSASLLGWKSPKPTVEREVNAKQVTAIILLKTVTS